MSVIEHAARWAGARMSRRLAKSLPWVGAAVALVTIAATVRRKGRVGGTVETALNAVPILGVVNNTAELVSGRDLIPDRHSKTPGPLRSLGSTIRVQQEITLDRSDEVRDTVRPT